MKDIRFWLVALGIAGFAIFGRHAFADESRSLSEAQLIAALNGMPTLETNISVATSSATTTVSSGRSYFIQCDAAADVAFNVASVTTSTGVDLAAGEKFYFVMANGATTVAHIAASATTCHLWSVK